MQLGLTSLDWAELYGGNGNQFIGHTTYGYGDTEIVAYSERLAQLFAANVAAMFDPTATDAPASLGAAVRDAKQRYLGGTLVLTPYDEKIMQSWTYYGLPMYTLGDIVPEPVLGGAIESFATTPFLLEAPQFPAESTPPANTANFTAGDDSPAQVDIVNGNFSEVPVEGEGSYFTVDGNTVVAQYRTVQPLVDVDIPLEGEYQGFLITGLSSRDLPGHVPFYARPMVDASADEGRIEIDDSAFPATLQRVTDVGDSQRLLVAAGQYEATSGQRLFDAISGELLPRVDGTDDVAPRFIDVEGVLVDAVGGAVSGRRVQFDVTTDETAERVVVLFRDSNVGASNVGDSVWTPVELVKQSTGRWYGTAPIAAEARVEFFVQSADANGNVGISSNKIENFLAVDGAEFDAELVIRYDETSGNEHEDRYYSAGSSFFVEFVPDPTVPGAEVPEDFAVEYFTVDSGAELAYNSTKGITLTATSEAGEAPSYDAGTGELRLPAGPHVLFAKDNQDNRVYRYLIFDPDAPQPVTITVADRDPVDGSVEVTITATDSGSGVKSITPTCTPGPCPTATLTPLDDDTATLTLLFQDEGETTITAKATDNLENVSVPTGETTVVVDRTPPDVDPIVTNPTGWTNGDVTVRITASDSGSGVAAITPTCQRGGSTVDCPTATLTPLDDDTATLTLLFQDEGETTITATATDNVGNTSTPAVSATTYIDRIRPTVDPIVVTPAASTTGWITSTGDVIATITARDSGGSGLASITPTCDPATACTITQPFAPTDLGATTATVKIKVTGIGATSISATAADRAGSPSSTVTTPVRVDRTAPTATLTAAGPYLVGDTFEFTCADATSGIKSCELFRDDETTPVSTTQGTYTVGSADVGTSTFTVKATDVAGNTSTIERTKVFAAYKVCWNYNPNTPKKSGSAYSVSITLCDPAGPSTGVTLTALTVDEINDPGPGAPGGSNPAYTFTLDNKGSYSYTIKTTGLSPGLHYLYFMAGTVDRAGLTTEQLQDLAIFATPFTIK